MAKGIFTTKVDPPYDDILEIRFHFPKTYLNYAKKMVGDWIIYYEPGRGGGRKSYFATARVEQIIEDKNRSKNKGVASSFLTSRLNSSLSKSLELTTKALDLANS